MKSNRIMTLNSGHLFYFPFTIYSHRISNKEFFRKFEKNCTFFTKNQAFSRENPDFFIVFFKNRRILAQKPLILRLLNRLCSNILTKELLFLHFLERLLWKQKSRLQN